MRDDELDVLLARTAPEPDERALLRVAPSIAHLVHATRPTRRSHLRPWHAVLAGTALVGGFALPAGITRNDAHLRVPPYVGIEDGAMRSNESIPVRYTTHDGHEVSCRTWIDVMDADQEVIDHIDDAIRGIDWSGFAQRTHDGLADPPPHDPTSLNPDEATSDAVARALWAFSEPLVDEVRPSDRPDLRVLALTTSCLREIP